MMWLREHNRIATELKEYNSYWSDETLFQEARRITIAVYQNIVYGTFLPAVIGADLMKTFKLNPLKVGHGYFYNDYLYANIYNEFATAAFPLINYLPHEDLALYGYDIYLSQTWWRQDLTYKEFHELIFALIDKMANKGGFSVATDIIDDYSEVFLNFQNLFCFLSP